MGADVEGEVMEVGKARTGKVPMMHLESSRLSKVRRICSNKGMESLRVICIRVTTPGSNTLSCRGRTGTVRGMGMDGPERLILVFFKRRVRAT